MKLVHLYNSIVSRFEAIGPLLARLTIALVFMGSGLYKFQNLESVIGFFKSLNIPMPELQAPMVATFELVGGALVGVGLLTRVAAAPLIGIMVVAILTAKLEDIKGFKDIFALSEALYIILLVWLIVGGPGTISLDKMVQKKNY